MALPRLNPDEKRTFYFHTTYATIEGFVLGILALNEFVFLKSMQGSNYQMSLLFQFSMAVFILLFIMNEWLKRVSNRAVLLRKTALITRVPLLALAFFPSEASAYINSSIFHFVFLGIFLIYYLGALVINPTINFLLKNNYEHQHFGKLYSYATSVNKIVMLLITFVYGVLLDQNYYIFKWSLPLAGLLSMIGLWLLSLIRIEERVVLYRQNFWTSVKASARDMIQILKTNKPYRHFEIGFMFYGFSFMVSVTVIAIFFYEGLDLNYSSVAFYKNAYNILAILLLPYFGGLLGNLDPRKFSVLTYSSIFLYIFFLMLTIWIPVYTEIAGIKLYYVLICYILAHGVFAATMVLLWNIGSAYFCRAEEAGTYQSVHLFLTGFRALFAPTLGVFFYEKFGLITTFTVALVSLAIAIGVNVWSYQNEKKIPAV
ncbi:MAG TPA: MFS transporter [Bacteroidales bacterium]|nr:MFS transporter [Bacteroidales bacterium]